MPLYICSTVCILSLPPVVKQDAESVLNGVFPCVVACGIKGVKNRSVKSAHNSYSTHSSSIIAIANMYVCRVEDYTLQMTGECSYFHGKFELINFKDIRRYYKENMCIYVIYVVDQRE